MYLVENLRHINQYINGACLKYQNCEPYYIEHWIVSHIIKVDYTASQIIQLD